VLKKSYTAKETVEKLAQVTGSNARNKIIGAYKAIEGFVMFSCIALGILQLCAIRFAEDFQKFPWRWLRTYSSSVPSEDTVADCLRKAYPGISQEYRKIEFLEIIRSKKHHQGLDFDLIA